MAPGDLDGDGNLDLAVANLSSDDVSVLLGRGEGSFAAELRFGAGIRPSSIAPGDVDGDGDPDLAVADNFSHAVSVLLNTCDQPACPGDLDGSGDVGFGDVLAIFAAWDNEGGPEDLDGSGIVDFGDVIVVLVGWGACP